MKGADPRPCRSFQSIRFVLGACILVPLCADMAGATVANDLCTGNPCVISSDKTVTAGSTLDFGTRAVVLQKTLTMGNLPGGAIGSFVLKAGTFTITGDGQIKGTGGALASGTADIQTTGNIALNGTRSTGTVRLTGTDAGTLKLTSSAGSVTATGFLNLDHEGIPASGGSLTVNAAGAVTLTGGVLADGGSQGGGGEIEIVAGGNVTLTGGVDLSAGEIGGGDVDITAGGSLTLGQVTMDGGGDTGDAGFGDLTAEGPITINGVYQGRGADNGENCGDGADLDLDAGGDVTISAAIDMRARALDCSGGSMTIFGDDVFLNSLMELSSEGGEGDGGSLDVDANTVSVTNTIELDGGDGGGGDISLAAVGNLTITGTIDARGRTSIGSGAVFVELDSGATLSLSGSILADGGSTGDGGDVLLDACTLRVEPGGVISATGTLGSIDLVANDLARLRGHFTVSASGNTDLLYGPASNPPDIAGAVFTGPHTLSFDSTLAACPTCLSNADCNDGDGCTTDLCVSGVCSHSSNAAMCDDSNPCTDDFCIAGACSNPPNSHPCSDGDACTDGDACSAGACAPGPPRDCSDGDVCTTDSCNSSSGCSNVPIPSCADTDGDGKIDDADECTTFNWTPEPVKPPDQNPLKLRLILKQLAAAPGGQQILFKGLFNPAASALSVDPSANGVNVYVEDTTGLVYDASVPGGLVGTGCGEKDGWSVSGTAETPLWKYRNVTGAVPPGCVDGSANGLGSVYIKDLRPTGKGAIQFKVKVKGATLDHSPGLPFNRLQATLALGARPSPGVSSQQAIEGQCAEAVLTGDPIAFSPPKPFCKIKEKLNVVDSINCKGL